MAMKETSGKAGKTPKPGTKPGTKPPRKKSPSKKSPSKKPVSRSQPLFVVGQTRTVNDGVAGLALFINLSDMGEEERAAAVVKINQLLSDVTLADVLVALARKPK